MRLLVCLLILNITLSTFGQTLTVFAASSLIRPFTELADQFEQLNPNVNIDLQFAGSSLLVSQLQLGAYADVLATANQATMARAVPLENVTTFASNEMLIVTNNPDIQELSDLASKEYFLVLAHRQVPAGMYAREVLSNLNDVLQRDFSDNVLRNLVSEENNVKQVLAKLELGEADAAVVYKTDLEKESSLRSLVIPKTSNVTAFYPITVLPESRQANLAIDFVSYVVSDLGQLILQKNGFGLP